MMRFLLVAAWLLFQAVPSVLAAPVSVDLQLEPVPECVVHLADSACVVGWDHGEQPGIADDDIHITQVVEHVGLALEGTPGTPGAGLFIDPSTVEIQHPVFQLVNRTWIQLNDSLPPTVKETVTLESRPMNTGEDNPPWGILVVVHPPVPVPNPLSGEAYTFLSVPVSWDCRFYFSSYANWDQACTEDTLRPLPNGISSTDDTDRSLAVTVGLVSCDMIAQLAPPTCPPLTTVRSAGLGIVDVWADTMPNVHVGAAIREISVQVGASSPENAPPAESRAGGSFREAATAPQAVGMEASEVTHPGAEAPLGSGPGRSSPLSGAAPLPPASVAFQASIASTSLGIVLGLAVAGALALLALYHRLRRDELLEQETRRAVYGAICAQPGIRLGTLHHILGRDYKTVQHHVRLLSLHGLVEGSGEGQQRLFPAGTFPPASKLAVVAASSPVAARVLEYLRAHGPTDAPTLCSALGLPKSSASMAISRLARAGLVEKGRSNRRLVVRPVPWSAGAVPSAGRVPTAG